MLDEQIRSRTDLAREAVDFLAQIDYARLGVARQQSKQKKAELGQFFTPAPLARFMASLFTIQLPAIHILDAGAGVGSLFASCVAELCLRENRPEQISITAYEIDETLIGYLQETLSLCQSMCEPVGITFTGKVMQRDFIEAGVELLQDDLFSLHSVKPHFHCAILNPPYKKIQTQSRERKLLQAVGIETSNIYTGFVELVTRLLEPPGELVAITPRSFCNGPYFRNFREHFLQTMSLRRLHVFDSRKQAFSDDDVLQENIILHASKDGKKPEQVLISSTTGLDDDFMLVHEVSYNHVVHPDDPQSFIRVVQDGLSETIIQRMTHFQTSLDELHMTVSTGRVVDFRALDFLRPSHDISTVPLLFPTHVGYGTITWPKPEGKKPNALLDNAQTKMLQIPNGCYVLVKRFTAKEEKKRIVAALYDPVDMPGSSVGFENHLNYFHRNGSGLDLVLARGLTAYLNSTLVDAYFRQFNGHTQVNATDLRNIKYPTEDQLEALGREIGAEFPEQHLLDALVRKAFFDMEDTQPGGIQRSDPIQSGPYEL